MSFKSATLLALIGSIIFLILDVYYTITYGFQISNIGSFIANILLLTFFITLYSKQSNKAN